MPNVIVNTKLDSRQPHSGNAKTEMRYVTAYSILVVVLYVN